MIVCVASDRVLLYGNLGGTAGKLYSCPNWDGSFLFSRTFNLYVEAIIMAYGMTARHSRHNALLNKIQAVGRGLFRENLSTPPKRLLGKQGNTAKHNVQSEECFVILVMRIIS